MTKARRKPFIIIAAALLVCGIGYVWLSYGLFFEREFGDPFVFKKHRLYPRFFFYSSVGERDMDDLVLRPAQLQAERDYEEFALPWLERYYAARREQN
ncbi:MAG: hypothetical protein JWO08_3157 [Verrucomicrobiaceae bacterium]|nr:hypothetical protein [Verrucomicrobiaceae bacterium]